MIQSIMLNNYMSHKSSTFELHPGMNAIIGESRAGKSTVIRALDLTRKNAIPMRHISHWARKRNKKGDMVLADRMSIAITTSHGMVERFRDAKENGYMVNGKKLLAVGTDVPAEVSEALNLTDVNFALQHDPHFFLSWAPGAISRYLNDICGMEVIDRATAIAIRLRNATRSEVDEATKQAETHAQAAKGLEWVEQAGGLLDKAKEASHCAGQARISAGRLGELVSAAIKAQETMEMTSWAVVARIAHSKALEAAEYARARWIRYGGLSGLVRGAEEATEALRRTARFSRALDVLGEAKAAMGMADEAFSVVTRIGTKVESAASQLLIMKRTARFGQAGTLLKDAETALKQAESAKSDAKALQSLVFEASKALQAISTGERWAKAAEVLERARKAAKRAEIARGDAAAVKLLVGSLELADGAVVASAKAIGLLKLQRGELLSRMPKICPTCGQTVNNCHLAL